VKTIVTTTKKAAARPLSQADLAVLAAVAEFSYLTAGQLGRLLYPDCHDDHRYARRRLARLADAGLLLRLSGLPGPRYGSMPRVYTLDRAGRQLLGATDTYFRPAEEHQKAGNQLFMAHTLATVDVLIAAELLCQTTPVTMPKLLTERQLRAHPIRVMLPAGADKPARSVAVIPDAWFELAVAGRQPDPIAVELDRGTHDQKRWRAKVAALAAWAEGPYRQVFDAQTLTIAVITPEEARRDILRRWTHQELTRLGRQSLDVFLFTSADPAAIAPAQFFFGPCWYEPEAAEPVSLLLPAPKPVAQVLPLPQRTV
jgi:hypothetical protein